MSESDIVAARKRVLAFTLNAGLFCDNRPYLSQYSSSDVVRYYHHGYSAGEHFVEFLQSIDVLDEGLTLTVERDALDEFAGRLIDKGLDFSSVVDALVCLGSQHWLPTKRGEFEATFIRNDDGTLSFDIRPLMDDLVLLGYAERVWTDDERVGCYFRWLPKISSLMKAHSHWPNDLVT